MSSAGESSIQYGYEQTLMYGRYKSELQDFARQQAAQLRDRRRHDHAPLREKKRAWSPIIRFFKQSIGADWISLLFLGIAMALLSFFVDYSIERCLYVRVWLYKSLTTMAFLQYIIWILYPALLIVFAVGFTHIVSAPAVGSGIPEMKTVLRGISLPDYLSLRTLVAKAVGLVASVGSGLPIGKEGPFVHLASILGHNMSQLLTNINSMYMNESRSSELLAAACAVGVSSNFAAPIGGVLFSIEVTATYFAVRNYWRGFFAAVCSAFIFRLMSFWIKDEETITTLFTTHFRVDFAFDLQELIAFTFIGIISGFGGALFVFAHRRFVDLRRQHRNSKVGKVLDKNRFVFPVLWVVIAMSVTFPLGVGRYLAGQQSHKDVLGMFFSNITWGKAIKDSESYADQRDDVNLINDSFGETNIFVSLLLFIFIQFVLTTVSVTLPVPAGVFFPVFVIGASFGRLVGEAMAEWYPEGITHLEILPGGYAVVGAAAMAGAVTHTISTSVIVFELTGQITHILPVMIAVLIANGIVQHLQPSIYDSIIMIKKMPYLPDLNRNKLYNITVSDMMRSNLSFVSYRTTYAQLRAMLRDSNFRSFPLVDAPASMILIGSVQRKYLRQLLHEHILKMHAERQRAVCGETVDFTGQEADDELPRESQNESEGEEIDLKETENQPKQQLNVELPAEPEMTTPQRLKASISYIPTRLRSLFVREPADDVADARDVSPALLEATLREDDAVLQKIVDFSSCHIDPAPFQLVETTNLYKVHTMFSLLGLTHTYVTAIGRLVGVVTLNDVARAVEGADRNVSVDHEAMELHELRPLNLPASNTSGGEM